MYILDLFTTIVIDNMIPYLLKCVFLSV